MTLEERIVEELQAERRRVPVGRPGTLPEMQPRWPRYLGTAALIGLIVAMAAWLGVPAGGPESQVAAALESGQLQIDGSVVLPVLTETRSVEIRGQGVPVLTGAPAPPLTVDIDLDGIEQPIVSAEPTWDQSTWAGNVPLLYVGDVSGRSVFVHTNGTISSLDRILAGGDIGAHVCMTAGDSHSAEGGAGFCAGSETGFATGGRFHDNDRGVPVGAWWVTWIDVPEGTAVVTLSMDGLPMGWQAPRGETAFFDLADQPSNPLTMTAISGKGEQLAQESVPTAIFAR